MQAYPTTMKPYIYGEDKRKLLVGKIWAKYLDDSIVVESILQSAELFHVTDINADIPEGSPDGYRYTFAILVDADKEDLDEVIAYVDELMREMIEDYRSSFFREGAER